jgi:DNA-binding MarR family transcriptional regulator
MMKEGSIEELNATWQLLSWTSRAVGKARHKELSEFGVSGDATSVMFSIVHLGKEATPSAIARLLIVEPHSVSQLLTRMEEDDLVRRVHDLEFKNLVRIELTEEGKEIYRQSLRRRSIKKMMSVLTAEERVQLWSSLAKLREAALKQIGKKPESLYPPSDRAELIEDGTRPTRSEGPKATSDEAARKHARVK